MNLNEMKNELTHTGERVGTELLHGGRNVWLAGLGLTGAVVEGGKDLFDSLVEKGRKADLRPEEMVREAKGMVREATQRVDSTVRTVGVRSRKAVEEATTTVLERFGVPSRSEVHALIDRVERLNAKLATMGPHA